MIKKLEWNNHRSLKNLELDFSKQMEVFTTPLFLQVKMAREKQQYWIQLLHI